MRINWKTSLTLGAALAAFGCSSTPNTDAGPGPSGPEPTCIATGAACAADAPCCTGSCIDDFLDAGKVCGIPPTFWIDAGYADSGSLPLPTCASPGSNQANSYPGCACSGNGDCLSGSCAASFCCGFTGGNLADLLPGCACAVDSDCASGSCSAGQCCDTQGVNCSGSPGGSSGGSSSGGSTSSGSSSGGSTGGSTSGGSSSGGGTGCAASGSDAGTSVPSCACASGADCASDSCSPTGQCCAPRGSDEANSPVGCACDNGDCVSGTCTNQVCS